MHIAQHGPISRKLSICGCMAPTNKDMPRFSEKLHRTLRVGPHAVFRICLDHLGRHGGDVELYEQGATVRRSSERIESPVIENGE